jgi:hypothetical protein
MRQIVGHCEPIWYKMKLDLTKNSTDSTYMASALVPRSTNLLGRPVSLPLGAIVSFVAVNLLLVGASLLALRQNMTLRSVIAHDEELLAPAKGTLIPALLGKDRTGATQSVSFGEDRRPTLFYSFTMGCLACRESWRAMHTLQELAPNSLRIIYIDAAHETLTPEYLGTSGIGQSLVLVKLLPPVDSAYDARGVPQLLLTDSKGRIQWAHMGQLSMNDVSGMLSLVKRD